MAGDGHSIIPQKSRALCRFNAELIKRYVIPAIIHGCLSKPSPPPRGNGEAASENEPVSYRLETSPAAWVWFVVWNTPRFQPGLHPIYSSIEGKGKADNWRRVDARLALDATARRLRLSWNITLIKPSWKKRERNNFLGRARSWEANGKLLPLSSVRLDNLSLVCLFCRWISLLFRG